MNANKFFFVKWIVLQLLKTSWQTKLRHKLKSSQEKTIIWYFSLYSTHNQKCLFHHVALCREWFLMLVCLLSLPISFNDCILLRIVDNLGKGGRRHSGTTNIAWKLHIHMCLLCCQLFATALDFTAFPLIEGGDISPFAHLGNRNHFALFESSYLFKTIVYQASMSH